MIIINIIYYIYYIYRRSWSWFRHAKFKIKEFKIFIEGSLREKKYAKFNSDRGQKQ